MTGGKGIGEIGWLFVCAFGMGPRAVCDGGCLVDGNGYILSGRNGVDFFTFQRKKHWITDACLGKKETCYNYLPSNFNWLPDNSDQLPGGWNYPATNRNYLPANRYQTGANNHEKGLFTRQKQPICVRMASVEKRGRYEKNLKSDCNDSLSLIFVTFWYPLDFW